MREGLSLVTVMKAGECCVRESEHVRVCVCVKFTSLHFDVNMWLHAAVTFVCPCVLCEGRGMHAVGTPGHADV